MIKRTLFFLLSFQLLNAQSIAYELTKIDWPEGWSYLYTYDQDTSSMFRKFFPGNIIILHNDTAKESFYVGECNEKNDFCYVTLNSDDDKIAFTQFGDVIMEYRRRSLCWVDREHPTLVSFIWNKNLFLTSLCPCIPDQDAECRKLEAILISVFGYEPGVPYDYIRSMK